MFFIGVDPGQSGGLVMLDANGVPLGFSGMPENEDALWSLIHKWSLYQSRQPVMAYIEKVRSSPQMSKQSIWVFAQGFGAVRAYLRAAGIPFVEVAPQKWQLFMGVRDKTGSRALKDVDITAKKNRHKEKAQQLFPAIPMTHKLADAALIAEYGRRLERGFGAELPG